MAYPSTLSSLATPQASDRLNNPSHSALHQNENTAITEIETFVGTLSSVQGSLVYDIRSSNSNGGGHVQTVDKGGTGQTSYTKGDLLVAQSTSVLSKLAISSIDGYGLVADSTQAAGVRWGLPGSIPSILVVQTASVFTYVKPSIFSYLRIRMVGGGGSNGSGTFGGPGGGAGYSEKTIPASSVAANVTCVVGAAGPVSSIGGTTTFGSVFSAAGGSPGSNYTGGGGLTPGGAGGTGTGGDVNITGETAGGQPRDTSFTTNLTPGGRSFIPLFGQGGTGQGPSSVYSGPYNGYMSIETY